MLTRQPTRPLCKNCKVSLAKPNGVSKHGFKKWHKYCVDCAKSAYNPKFGYLLSKSNCCSSCGFVAVDKCQLDIVYKDNNSKNKTPENLITICANCNRLLKRSKKEKSILDITVDSDLTV